MRKPQFVSIASGAIALLVLVLVLVLVLSGCVPSNASLAPEPSPSFIAPYATDDEALSAANIAYAQYVRVINEALRSQVFDETSFESVVVGEELDNAIEVYSRLASDGLHSSADITFDQVSLQRYARGGSLTKLVTILVCEDLSKAFLLDRNGSRVREDDIPPRVAQVSFDYSAQRQALLLSDRQPQRDSPC
ncbi:MAG: hypothetical protein ACOH1K_07045 [Rhodoglobus sp.]